LVSSFRQVLVYNTGIYTISYYDACVIIQTATTNNKNLITNKYIAPVAQ
jgi:hypothetical protein